MIRSDWNSHNSGFFYRFLRDFTRATAVLLAVLITVWRVSSIFAWCIKALFVQLLSYLSLFIFSLMMTNDSCRGNNRRQRLYINSINLCSFFCLLLSDFSLFLLIQLSFLLLRLDPLCCLFQFNLPLSISSFLNFLQLLLVSEVLFRFLLLSLTLSDLLLQLFTNRLLLRVWSRRSSLWLFFFGLSSHCVLGMSWLMILLLINCLRWVIQWWGILWYNWSSCLLGRSLYNDLLLNLNRRVLFHSLLLLM